MPIDNIIATNAMKANTAKKWSRGSREVLPDPRQDERPKLRIDKVRSKSKGLRVFGVKVMTLRWCYESQQVALVLQNWLWHGGYDTDVRLVLQSDVTVEL